MHVLTLPSSHVLTAPPPAGAAPPGVDPTIYSWFTTVDADRSGSITSAELQQALTNGNWSHFNAETCRLMIGKCAPVLWSGNHIWTYEILYHLLGGQGYR